MLKLRADADEAIARNWLAYPRLGFAMDPPQTTTDSHDIPGILGESWAIHVSPKWPLVVR